MKIWINENDKSLIKWQHDSGEIHVAELDDLIEAYEDMQEITDIEKALHTPTNFNWIKTLTPEEFTKWYYDFWDKEQNRYSSSRDALEWWLQQIHNPEESVDKYLDSISIDTGIKFDEVIDGTAKTNN